MGRACERSFPCKSQYSIAITAQRPIMTCFALSKILLIGRWKTRNLAGWAQRSVELVRSGLPKAEIWRLRRWRIAWEIWGRWLAMASVHLQCPKHHPCNQSVQLPLCLVIFEFFKKRLPTRGRKVDMPSLALSQQTDIWWELFA